MIVWSSFRILIGTLQPGFGSEFVLLPSFEIILSIIRIPIIRSFVDQFSRLDILNFNAFSVKMWWIRNLNYNQWHISAVLYKLVVKSDVWSILLHLLFGALWHISWKQEKCWIMWLYLCIFYVGIIHHHLYSNSSDVVHSNWYITVSST